MRAHSRGRHGALIAVVAMLVIFAGACGGDDTQERAAAARAYATQVATVTDATRTELTATSTGADYRDPAAAARTTRAYAVTIGRAADQLGAADPPAAVAGDHGRLVALYRATAARLQELAVRFDGAAAGDELTELAQDLSSEVQALSTQEAQLRGAIDRRLATVAPTAPAP